MMMVNNAYSCNNSCYITGNTQDKDITTYVIIYVVILI